MFKFVQINSENINLVNHLYEKFKKYIEDDYNEDTLAGLIHRTYPYFWVILSDTSFAGFVYLENICGNAKKFHSAEITTCFEPRFWGDFTKECARYFLTRCFKEFGFIKIKALVYPENSRVKTLLKSSGFKKEALLKAETIRSGRLQDIEIYTLYRNEVENEN